MRESTPAALRPILEEAVTGVEYERSLPFPESDIALRSAVEVSRARLELNRVTTQFALDSPGFTLVELLNHVRDQGMPIDLSVAPAWFLNEFMDRTVDAFQRGGQIATWTRDYNGDGARAYWLDVRDRQPEAESLPLPETEVEAQSVIPASPLDALEDPALEVVVAALSESDNYAGDPDVLTTLLHSHFGFSDGDDSAMRLLYRLRDQNRLSIYAVGNSLFASLPGLELSLDSVTIAEEADATVELEQDDAFNDDEVTLAQRILADLESLTDNQYTLISSLYRRLREKMGRTDFRAFVQRLETRGVVEQGTMNSRDRGRFVYVKWRSPESKRAWTQRPEAVTKSLRDAFVINHDEV